MILVKNLQVYPAHVYIYIYVTSVCWVWYIPVTQSHVASSKGFNENPTTKKGKLHLVPGIHSTIGSKQQVETHLMKSWLFKNRIPISWIFNTSYMCWIG